jgi:hypothetical protein
MNTSAKMLMDNKINNNYYFVYINNGVLVDEIYPFDLLFVVSDLHKIWFFVAIFKYKYLDDLLCDTNIFTSLC